jgi:hypothetical protein
VTWPTATFVGCTRQTTPWAEELWNESWYFDFTEADAGVGGWVRVGLVPNQGVAWINALVCGPDLPTVAVVDFHAPLPADIAEVRTEEAAITLSADEPLRRYRVTMRGRAQAFDEPAGLLHGEQGRSVELTMDLTWESAGIPYQYRVTPRYEIPCRVSGELTADGRTFTVRAAPGQRDHSWGVRDWWGMDWVWSALHLDDGTHLHGVDIRMVGRRRSASAMCRRRARR